jgi:hypothetical protein
LALRLREADIEAAIDDLLRNQEREIADAFVTPATFFSHRKAT